MKNIIKISLITLGLSFSQQLFAAEKTYIRDYTYQASETDSKVSARETALLFTKQNLLSEIGTYVDSSINLFSSSSGVNVSSQQIKAITEGFIKTEILEEKWNGVTFFVKARLTADPDNIADRLRKIYQSRNKSVNANSEEFEYWKSVVQIDAVDSYVAYMDKYPKGKYEELAQIAIMRLHKQKLDEEKNNKWLVKRNGLITLVARHDVGRMSDLDSDVITAEMAKSAENIIKNFVASDTSFKAITDFNQTEHFRANQEGHSQVVCASEQSDMVAGVMLEDHSGSGGMQRPIRMFIYNCNNKLFRISSFIPKQSSKKDFWRDASMRKHLRVFVQDYLDSI